ncbi:MAG: ABC transporter ATP-binding protein, partial [Candidatus Eremiobacteraeota bacterium]|nr:ABC transporter ATP-binding protein [Candidatus Eremiobacteraeota bacterium]
MAAEIAIDVRDLYKSYGTRPAVQGISFEVRRGEIFGLIGPDGAGKTTTFHILAGIMNASSGTVNVLGKTAREARLQIGYLTQQFSLYPDLSVDENLRYVADVRLVDPAAFGERRDRYLTLLGLEGFGGRLARELSGGMKQKLALCCALIAEPAVLLLDEPTTGVDPVSRREFWRIVARLAGSGVSVVIATPYLDEAERCHRLGLMIEGRFRKVGTPDQLRRDLGLMRLEVQVDDPRAADALLEGMRGGDRAFAEIQLFGDRLDVLTADPARAQVAVQDDLARAGVHATYSVREPTIENVFVAELREERDAPERVPSFPRADSASPAPTGIAIDATHLIKRFGTFTAVDDVSLQVRYGEIYGLLGANGAGKTTTIKMICGLLEPSSGSVNLAGHARDLRSTELRRKLGYMSQKFTLYDDLTIEENLQFYAGVYRIPSGLRKEKIQWVLETCDLAGRERLITGSLPGGWKQRLGFGAAVMHEPTILFLDEPTSGVDPIARQELWDLIGGFAAMGTAIVVTTHHLEEAEHCERICMLSAGKIVAEGSPSQLKAREPGTVYELD